MSLTVQVHFIGLFILVQQGNVMHAVVPLTGQHAHVSDAHTGDAHAEGAHAEGGHAKGEYAKGAAAEGVAAEGADVPRHEARLFLGLPDVAGGEFPLPWSVPLEGYVLSIREEGRPDSAPAVPQELLDLTELTGGARLKAAALEAPPHATGIQARVDLDLRGSPRAEGRARYRIPGTQDDVVKSSYTVWDARVGDGRKLSIQLLPLAGGTPIDLTPPASDPKKPNVDSVVSMVIYHVVHEEMPPNAPPEVPEQPKAIGHFAVYYGAMDAPQQQPIPVFVKPEEGEAGRGGETGSCPNVIARR